MKLPEPIDPKLFLEAFAGQASPRLSEAFQQMLDDDLAADADPLTNYQVCDICGEGFHLDRDGGYRLKNGRAVCPGCEQYACDQCGLQKEDCDCI